MGKDEWIRVAPGIRCRKHPTRKHGAVKPDMYFVLRFRVDGKAYQEALGWASEGMTLEKAKIELGKLKEAHRLGTGARSLREKREIEETRRHNEKEAQQQESACKITFTEYWTNSYWPAQLK